MQTTIFLISGRPSSAILDLRWRCNTASGNRFSWCHHCPDISRRLVCWFSFKPLMCDRQTYRHRRRLKPPSHFVGWVLSNGSLRARKSVRFNDIQCITAISIPSVVCTVGYLCVSVVCAAVRVYCTSMWVWTVRLAPSGECFAVKNVILMCILVRRDVALGAAVLAQGKPDASVTMRPKRLVRDQVLS